MKVVILAGGYGTRISEESHLRPKPMVEIGERPILWHIMKIYSHYGFNDFIVCCGYKAEVIKEYFMNYYMHESDVTFDLKNNTTQIHNTTSEPWKVTLVNTGLDTTTAGRVKKVRKYVGNETFMITYGDGVSNININELVKFHREHGKIATISSTRPAGRFGAIQIDDEISMVNSFREKPKEDQAWVNAGFSIFESGIFDYLGDCSEMLEKRPYENLANDGEMMAFKHYGFWSPMDTIRDKNYLEELWKQGDAPWKLW